MKTLKFDESSIYGLNVYVNSFSIPIKDGVKQIDFGKLYNEKLGDVEQAHKSLAKGYEDEAQKEKKQSERLGTNIAAVIYDAEPDIKTLVRFTV